MKRQLPVPLVSVPMAILLVWCVWTRCTAADAARSLLQADVFVSGTGGYHTYRIPAIVLTTKGTLLAFCEGRKTSSSDAGDIDLVLRRSTDGGKTWEKMQLVYEEGGTARSVLTRRSPLPGSRWAGWREISHQPSAEGPERWLSAD